MRLRGIEFGHVLDAAGSRNFFGEGYLYQHLMRPLGLQFDASTFVAKTTTLEPRTGNMPMREDGITPREFSPRCIVVKPFHGVVLNAVGLSGPGAKFLFETGLWQSHRAPFFLSFMSIASTKESRIEELRMFVKLFQGYHSYFLAPVGLQINYSCPNVGLHTEELADEVLEGLEIASSLRIPLVPKFNVLLRVETARKIAEHPSCDALCASNTIPWGMLPEKIDWQGLFGTLESPLAHLGGGGLSGAPLLPLVADWVRRAREAGITKPINAGGGILHYSDIDVLLEAGASSVFLGSISILRGWRVRETIHYANELFGERGRYEY